MSKLILIVDDSATMLMSVRTNLEIHGFRVDSASNGAEALQKLESGCRPDLIITDINMPEMDGLTLIKRARSLPGLRFIPILALTTESQQAKRDEAKQIGATGWLVKPLGGTDLLNVIRQVLPGA